ncbi:MAG: hypothetical protein CMI60_21320 [Parvibaculum sp.]|nr:hypothetical protein [Parvibaculum sp.]
MENIKKLQSQADFNTLENNIDKIINESVYHDREWNDDEIAIFVSQFNSYQDDAKEQLIDMEKLDSNFVSEKEYKQKFNGFDDATLKYMCELENKKLEDARIPPLIVRNETVTLKNNLSEEVYNGKQTDAKCDTNCESNSGRFTQEKKEKEKA